MGKEVNRIICFFIFLVYSCQMLSQIKVDTIELGNESVIFFYPKKSKVSVTNYEEGFFKDIRCIEDSAYMGLHQGCMVTLPLIDHQNKTIVSEYVIKDVIRQTRGFYYLNGEKKYFREDNIYKKDLNLYYSDVPEVRLFFYEWLLNSFKYTKVSSESQVLDSSCNKCQ